MESRKIIGFGKSSYVLSLPKRWIQKNKLSKGDVVYISESLNNLTLLPSSNKTDEDLVEMKISVSDRTLSCIKRKIISSYINGVNVLYISGRGLADKSKEIRKVLQGLIALEIVQESADKIIARDFLNMNAISITNIIRKIDIIIRSMFIDTRNTLLKGTVEDLDRRDDDINRLTFLVFRVIKSVMYNPSLGKDRRMDLVDLMNARHFTFNLEKIADALKKIIKTFSVLEVGKRKREELAQIFMRMEKGYLNTMASYYEKDRDSAYKISKERKEIINSLDIFFESTTDRNVRQDVLVQLHSLMLASDTLIRIIHD